MSKILKCDICEKEFFTKYYEDGSICHENWVGEGRIKSYLEKGIDYTIRKLDMREDNFCNVQRYDLSFQKSIVKCVLIWLEENNYKFEKDEIVNYFKTKEKIINSITKKNKDFSPYYIVDYNVIVDFYCRHNLESKQFEIIKVNNENERLEAKYFWCIKVDEEYFVISKGGNYE